MRRTLILLGLVLVAGATGVASWLGTREASAPAAQPPRAGEEERPTAPVQTFRSRPDLRPPRVAVNVRRDGASDDYVFIAPKRGVEQSGPMILDARGNLVWFKPLERGIADFRAQRYRGEPVLTWWQGESEQGIGDGSYVIYDSSYRQIAEVKAGNGLTGDIHEFLITPDDTALITIYRRIPTDLREYGGPEDGAIYEGVVQEIDIETGDVLFEWHSLPDVAVEEGYVEVAEDGPHKGTLDYFHINSVDVDSDGNFLLSARNTQAIYKVSRTDGSVIWRLGGKRSDFRMLPGSRFAWQHDARRQTDGTLTLFDNATVSPNGPPSRGLVLELDEQAMTARMVREYVHPKKLRSFTQGNMQVLDNGNVFVGWGQQPYYTEFTRDGRVVLDASFAPAGVEADSYRAYRADWVGEPTDAALVTFDGDTGYVSWNGATEIRAWMTTCDGEQRRIPRRGFETALPATGDDCDVSPVRR